MRESNAAWQQLVPVNRAVPGAVHTGMPRDAAVSTAILSWPAAGWTMSFSLGALLIAFSSTRPVVGINTSALDTCADSGASADRKQAKCGHKRNVTGEAQRYHLGMEGLRRIYSL